MAECHPVGFQWVMEAKQRGAKVIHIDPRFTRTSAVADQHVPIRVGSDIAFLGGVVRYILENEKDFREYVVAYTNAATILRDDFVDTEDLDGLFSGYDPETASYDGESWQYAGHDEEAGPQGQDEEAAGESGSGHELGGHGATMEESSVQRDETLQHPRCVYQVLKRHYARYTPEVVEQVCGVSQEDFLAVCEAVTANSGRERTTCWVYSVGWTHHSTGVQYIRGAAIIQLLLGNMGRPGGGILALRGHASIQGSTDIPTLYNLLPGYLPMPVAGEHDSLADWIAAMSSKGMKGFWASADAYAVSLLKAWYGDTAQPENDYCFDLLPKLTGDHGTYQTVMDQIDGTVEGYFLVGQNPAVGSAQAKMQRQGLANLKWLVVRDVNLIESATFWQDGPEIASGELRTEDIGTEVFFLPAATHTEKAGSFTQTQRMVQWRHKAVDPPGDARPELDFYYELGRRLRERLAGSTDPKDRALLDLTWDYRVDEHGEPDAESILAEINGTFLTGERAGEPLPGFTSMRADGSTAGGCWIYTGIYKDGVNQAARRKPGQEQDWVANQWGWAWPMDRRTLYNRASADPEGKPWSARKAYVWWDETLGEAGEWTGHDVPDFELTKPPSYRPPDGAGGPDGLAGDDPFIMQADGKGWLYAPSGLLDGPMPAHYEPHESPVRNPLYHQQANPTRQVIRRKDNLSNPSAGEAGSEVFPYVFTTYRLTEHHTAGGMSRWVPYLAELQPEMFCEVSPELARERGLENLSYATIVTARTAIEARVLVTERVTPLMVDGRVVHQIGLPYHWGVGKEAHVSGDSANDLLGLALDPNVHIQESKVGSCDIQPGRRPSGPALLRFVEEYRSRAGITVETGNTQLTPRTSMAPTDAGDGS
jgi:formate dehydrogenase major subunit